jgi:hypothetical protein
MDVLHFIKESHHALRQRCSDLKAETRVKGRRAALDALAKDLDLHLTLEQDYLYPELIGLFNGAEAMTTTGQANGMVVKRRLKTLQKLVAGPAAEQVAYPKKLDELLEAVATHFDVQEQTLMPKIRDSMRTEDREDLGDVLIETKSDLAAGANAVASSAPKARKRA